MSDVRRFVGGPLCGTPVPGKAGTFLDLESGVYEDRGDHYLFRGAHMRRCECGSYVEVRDGTRVCPLCGGDLRTERERERPTMPPGEPS